MERTGGGREPSTMRRQWAAMLALISCAVLAAALPSPSSAYRGAHARAFAAAAETGGVLPAPDRAGAQTPATPVSFGIERFALTAIERGGSPDTQAGSHPYELTAEVGLNQTLDSEGEPVPVGSVKDLHFELPAGVSIDTDPYGYPVMQCGEGAFLHQDCPNSAAVGVARVTAAETTYPAPVYELAPAPGEPVRLGFVADSVPLVVTTAIRSGGDYGITASIRDVSEVVSISAITLTLWGVPADTSHDAQRGSCLSGGETNCAGPATPVPFITMPTSCGSELQTTIRADSWQEPEASQSAATSMPALSGCALLAFEPAITVASDTARPDQPSAYELQVRLAQDEEPTGLATSELENALIAMPLGVSLSPAGLEGLSGCSEAQIALTSAQPGSCPQASSVGAVELTLPFLSAPVTGHMYRAPEAHPFESPAALYLEAQEPRSGLLIKLPVGVEVTPGGEQLTFELEQLPQLPFSEITLELFGGPRALLINPPQCGVYPARGYLSPWDGSPESVELISTLAIEDCPNPSIPTRPPSTSITTTTNTGTEEQKQTPAINTQGPNANSPGTTSTQHQPPPKPSISHIRARRSGDRLLVTFTTSTGGAITLTGVGVLRRTEDVRAGAHEIRLTLNRRGKASRREHRSVKLELVLTSRAGSVSAHFALEL